MAAVGVVVRQDREGKDQPDEAEEGQELHEGVGVA